MSLSCSHCEKPSCAEACPVGAITKREENGIMMVNREECLGHNACGACKKACPYGVPQFGEEDNARMQMCTFCIDRLQQGKKPACVDACPMRALDSGPIELLTARYGAIRDTFSTQNKPSIIIKPRY